MKNIVKVAVLGLAGLCVFASIANAFVMNQAANIVLGQDDMNSNTSGVSDSKFSSPVGIYCDDNNLYVADMSNNRVLIYNGVPTENAASATWVIGQSNMSGSTPNNGGVGLNTLYNPRSVCSDGTKLIIADSNNNRVLIYNSIPTNNDVSADVVIGQVNGTLNSSNRGGLCSADGLNQPSAVCLYNGKLFIADTGNNRILIYNTIPVSHGAAADVVIGQSDFLSNGNMCAQNRMYAPNGVWIDDGKIYISDTGYNRVLIYNSIPGANNANADFVLGQTSFSTSEVGHSQTGLYATIKLFAANSELYVGDTLNHRIMVFNTSSLMNNQLAETVIGQSNFTEWSDGVSERKLSNPSGVFVKDEILFIADYDNHRVLMYSEPNVTDVNPNYGVENNQVKVTLSGKYIDQISGVDLVKGTETITATNIVSITNEKKTCMFQLDGSPGIYHLQLNANGGMQIHENIFSVLEQSIGQGDWLSRTVGALSTPPIDDVYCGIVVGDIDNDGVQKIFVANRNTQIMSYNYLSNQWVGNAIPNIASSDYYSSLVICDPDNNKQKAIYTSAVNAGYSISEHVYPDWTGTNIGNGNGKIYDMAWGDGDNDGIMNLYAGCENGELYQVSYESGWSQETIGDSGSGINAIAVGDAQNMDWYNLYSANVNGYIYQYYYNGTSWETTSLGAGLDEMKGLAVGDGNRDGQIEVYGANKDGKIYRFNWAVISWVKSGVADLGVGLKDIKVSDADNDGQNEVYVTTDDGRLFQCSYVSNQWSSLEIGDVGANVNKIAIGDGDNNNSFEIYGIAANNNVYQFEAWNEPTATPIPTGTITPTVTKTPIILVGFDGQIISEKYIYAAPNPIRGTKATIHYVLKEAADIELKIFTTSNQLVASYNMSQGTSGHFTMEWPCANIANGIYLVRVSAKSQVNGKTETVIKKIALVK